MAKTLRKLYLRAVPEEWERQLAEISPPNPRFSWLKLIWEPGDPWDKPVERYIIYQMVPFHAIPADILAELQGPSPRKRNYYDSVLERFVRDPDCLITLQAWELFRTTKCWGRPWWVIQGDKGGHKRYFSHTEKKLLRLMKLPVNPPIPGDLPYAEFDNRVIRQILLHDNLRHAQGGILSVRNGPAGRAATAEKEKEFRIALMKWLKDQAEMVAPDIHRSLVALDAPRRRGGPDYERLDAEMEENYVETGSAAPRKLIVAP